MINYNMSFLISALVFLVLLFYHFVCEKRLEDVNSQIFRLFILVGIADVLFDIICTVLIMKESDALAGVMQLAMTIFYFMQVLFPYAFL